MALHRNFFYLLYWNLILVVSFCGAQYEDYSPRPVLYCDGKTLAEVMFDTEGTMVHCRLHELEEESDAEPLIQNSGLLVKYPSFQTMLQLINNCSRLERPRQNTTYLSEPPNNSVEESSTPSSTSNSIYDWSPWTLWNGIMPGTKWCGVGDIAGSFEELGSQIEVDACCRAHDHCPVKLKAFRAGYGIINLSLYTKSHCDCDMEFFSCLKTSNNKMADAVGSFYFNIMKVPCLREYRPFVCVQNITLSDGTEECIKWGADIESKNMQVSSTPLKY